MFAAALHAAPVESALQRQCQRGNGVGLAVEAAVADYGALPPIQIQHRRKRQIHAAGAQFCRQHPAHLFRRRFCRRLALFFPNATQRAHGRQAGKTFDKTLHPAALVIHGNHQFRRTQCLDFGTQSLKLAAVLVIAAKQNHAAHSGVQQALFFFLAQAVGGNIGHNRAARQANGWHSKSFCVFSAKAGFHHFRREKTSRGFLIQVKPIETARRK